MFKLRNSCFRPHDVTKSAELSVDFHLCRVDLVEERMEKLMKSGICKEPFLLF